MVCLLFWLGWVDGLGAAEAAFSRTLRPADFAAAGLSKLSPEELARLDALVGDFRSAARAEAVEQARVEPETRPARGGTKAPAVGAPAATGPAQARVKLAPGTAVEYEAAKSRIAGQFTGWEPRTVFVLENGQRWQVAGDSTYSSPPLTAPAVEIAPGFLGSFWLKIDGVSVRVKVTLVGQAR